MNEDRINTRFSPDNESIYSKLADYKTGKLPPWISAKRGITNFKRNFHIFDRTGMFKPMQTLQLLSDSIIDEEGSLINELPFDYGTIKTQQFPPLQEYQSNQIRTFTPSGKATDMFEQIIRREKANRDHGRILERIASTMRANGIKVFENIFIDLLAVIGAQDFIFEVKSNDTKNALSQIRKAIAQLYEYRCRSKRPGAILCIVLQQKPVQDWVINYLVKDRNILICWMIDDFRFECPTECFTILSLTGIVQ